MRKSLALTTSRPAPCSGHAPNNLRRRLLYFTALHMMHETLIFRLIHKELNGRLWRIAADGDDFQVVNRLIVAEISRHQRHLPLPGD